LWTQVWRAYTAARPGSIVEISLVLLESIRCCFAKAVRRAKGEVVQFRHRVV
jgi:hypothetical protein